MDWIKRFSLLDFEEKQDTEYIVVDSPKRSQVKDESLPEMTRAQVSDESSMSKALVIIADYVYDITSFIKEHPGGDDILFEHIGRDITVTYTDVGHSKDATSMISKYRIGKLPQNECFKLKGKAALLNDI